MIKNRTNNFFEAIINNDFDTVNILIDYVDLVNIRYKYREKWDSYDALHPPLNIALDNGYFEIANLLLNDPRVDPSIESVHPCNRNITAIIMACGIDYENTLCPLLKNNNINTYDHDDIKIINKFKNDHYKIVVRLLKDERIDHSIQNNSALIDASSNGHLVIVNSLLNDPRVDPSDQGNLAIIGASDNGYVKIVDRLLKDKRVDPSVDCNDPIMLASMGGHTDVVVRLLKDKRVNQPAVINMAIIEAYQNGHTDIVNILSSLINTRSQEYSY